MSARQVLELQDLDDLLALVSDRENVARLKRVGYSVGRLDGLAAHREALAQRIERRWHLAYDRAAARWGRGLTPVRQRVCQGCFVTLPTSAAPQPGESSLHVCEGCGRLLWWR